MVSSVAIVLAVELSEKCHPGRSYFFGLCGLRVWFWEFFNEPNGQSFAVALNLL